MYQQYISEIAEDSAEQWLSATFQIPHICYTNNISKNLLWNLPLQFPQQPISFFNKNNFFFLFKRVQTLL